MDEFAHDGITLRRCPGYDGMYYAGSDGAIYSIRSGVRKLNPRQPPSTNYLVVTMYDSAVHYDRADRLTGRIYSIMKPQSVYVHQMICAAWHGPRPSPDHEVDHENEQKHDNRPENLSWQTRRRNYERYFENHPLAISGSRNGRAKLCEGDVLGIRALQGVMSLKRVGRLWGIDRRTVWDIWKGRTWQHVA